MVTGKKTRWGLFPQLGMMISKDRVTVMRRARLNKQTDDTLPGSQAEDIVLDTGTVDEERLYLPLQLYDRLRTWRKETGPKLASVYLYVPDGQALLRTFTYPRLKRADIPAFLRTEQALGRLMPLDQPFLTYTILSEAENTMRLAVSALPEKTVRLYSDTLTALGYRIIRILPAVYAYAPYFVRGYGSSAGRLIGIVRRPDGMKVVIVENGQPVFIRTFTRPMDQPGLEDGTDDAKKKHAPLGRSAQSAEHDAQDAQSIERVIRFARNALFSGDQTIQAMCVMDLVEEAHTSQFIRLLRELQEADTVCEMDDKFFRPSLEHWLLFSALYPAPLKKKKEHAFGVYSKQGGRKR